MATAARRPPQSLPDPRASQQLGMVAAVIFHLALLALLSFDWTERTRDNLNPPMEVDLVAEVAPVSTAPEISETPPAAKLGEEEALAPDPLIAPPPLPAPPVKKLPTKIAPTKAIPAKAPQATTPPKQRLRPTPTGRLDGIAAGLSQAPTKAPASKGAPAAQTAAEVRKSIDVAIDGKILPHWRRNVPSGIEIDQLRVVLQIELNQNGSVADIRQKGELIGKTDSNKPQQALFVERAIRSIRQAAPFDLPAEYYEQWRVWDVTFRARGI